MNIQCSYSFCSPFSPFSWIIVINLLMRLCLVPRSLCKINMVSELMTGWSSISLKQDFWQISPWKVSNSSKIQHCTRSQGLPLNIPSKEIIDQALLIDYVGCDESLKCTGCLTLHCPLFCDIQVFDRWKHSLQQIQMAASVHLLTPFNFHSWKGDMEI